jgi:hypothetical protein
MRGMLMLLICGCAAVGPVDEEIIATHPRPAGVRQPSRTPSDPSGTPSDPRADDRRLLVEPRGPEAEMVTPRLEAPDAVLVRPRVEDPDAVLVRPRLEDQDPLHPREDDHDDVPHHPDAR